MGRPGVLRVVRGNRDPPGALCLKSPLTREKEMQMDKEHLKGEGKKIEGQTKEAVGDMTDDERLEAEGKADQVEGETRKTVGDAKDAVKD